MEVTISNMQDLFVAPVRYEVPQFQRAYVWNKEKQWDPLWEDISNMAEATLEHNLLQRKPPGHFLGAVVLQQKRVPTPMFQHRIVVDGQQRLITLQLLLNAVGDIFEEYGDKNSSSRLHDLVTNAENRRGGNPDNRFKVWPTKTDQGAFRYAMSGGSMFSKSDYSENGISPIIEAHDYFKTQIRFWLNDKPIERSEALEQTVTQLLELVVIDLGDSDNPHVIFETLNARGTPLLQSDLVKNMILYEANKHASYEETRDLDQLWSFQNDWWREEIRQGRILRPRVDVFLYYWMLMRRMAEFAPERVFPEFRKYCVKKDIYFVAKDMNNIGKIYNKHECDPDPYIETFRYRMKTMQIGALNPIILWLLSEEVIEEQLLIGLEALESHLIRRMVCRMNTRGYNRLFVNLLKELNGKPEKAGDIIQEYLLGQDSNVGQWPSDDDFEDSFINFPLYQQLTRGRLRIVLEGIEEALRTSKTETQSVPSGLTIEHIMPQQWHRQWRTLPSDVDNAEENRNRVIHTIGNLTLVNHRLNLGLSNAPWKEKQKTLHDHSVLFLNKNLLDNAPNEWNEASIGDRAKQLYEIAKRIWPRPT